MLLSFVMMYNILGMISQTGAFEIYANNKLIYSKIESGRFPDPERVIKAITEAGIELKHK